ncbi:MAG TPA: FKBP-type peptidyl-prolyl cis-trans isomerase [Saprospiraceae bacterium]|nr:FKBP-type peptidyl-prolyl cis-trans isomerase [Saprospiraceae bacterium]
MNPKFLFFVLGLGLLVSCSTEGKRLKADGGYEYQMIRKGESKPIPMENYVFFNMDLYYQDSLIQSSSKTAAQPPVLKITAEKKDYSYFTSLINLLGKMHVRDSFHFFFPVDSFGQVPPGFEKFTEPVVYRIGIIKVMDEAQFKTYSDSLQQAQELVRQAVRDKLPAVETMVKGYYDTYKKGGFDSQMQTTPSGLRYVIHEEGTGPKPAKGEQVSVAYYGMLDADGKMFDNSWNRGMPHQFPLGQGQVIQGWDEGLQLFNKGTKATLFIPANLGYGAAGNPPSIPENAALIFYVELENK